MWTVDSLYADELPYEIYLVLINSTGFSGATTTKNFAFEHFELEYMNFQIEGTSGITFEPNFDDMHY